MQIKKLLIIDPSDDFCEILAEKMRSKFVVRTCLDGETALEMLLQWKPDTVVVNPILRNLDGITLLQRAAEKGLSPSILMVTNHISQYLQDKAQQMNISYIMLKPCAFDVLSERICDLTMHLRPAPPPPSTLMPIVAKMLEDLGLENHRDGFLQLQVGIPLLVDNRHLRFTKELYPAIGKIMGISHSSIEKTIRDTIQAAWSNRDEEIWRNYFPVDPSNQVIHPTNKSFMLILADYIDHHYFIDNENETISK